MHIFKDRLILDLLRQLRLDFDFEGIGGAIYMN